MDVTTAVEGARAAANRRTATVLVAGLGVAVGLVVLVVLVLVVPVLVAVAVALVAGAAAAAGLHAGAEPLVARRIPSRPAEVVAEARLLNLVEGLCTSAGVPRPVVRVVDDPAPNALALGRDPRRATLMVTSGLLALLSRVELEGVVAQQLVHIKQLDTRVRVLAVALFALPGIPGLRDQVGKVAGPDGETAADLAGVLVTRYPPGLLAALEKLRGVVTEVGAASPATAILWFAAPATRPAIEERIEVLREL